MPPRREEDCKTTAGLRRLEQRARFIETGEPEGELGRGCFDARLYVVCEHRPGYDGLRSRLTNERRRLCIVGYQREHHSFVFSVGLCVCCTTGNVMMVCSVLSACEQR